MLKQHIASFTASQWRWSIYDWANSAFALVITSTIFPIYFLSCTQGNAGRVDIFGTQLLNASLFSYTIAAAFMLMLLTAPLLSAVADGFAAQKSCMMLLAIVGGAACMALFFFDKFNIQLGVFGLLVGVYAYSGGVLINNSYLPLIASNKELERVSALGFSMGFLGSVLLQLVLLITIQWHSIIGISESLAVRIGFVAVGFWWILFGVYASYTMPRGTDQYQRKTLTILVSQAYTSWYRTIKVSLSDTQIKYFIIAYFFYTSGVQTIMFLATIFAEKEINMPESLLILTIFLIQLLAIAGAYSTPHITKRLGKYKTLFLIILLWILICLLTYLYVYTAVTFMLIAACVGVSMGAIQSLSRATFSALLMPTADRVVQFSVYDMTEKLAIVTGTFTFALVGQLTSSLRVGILPVIGYFIIGAGLLYLWFIRNTTQSTTQSTTTNTL